MTQEDSLREALKYVADCLEKDEVYSVNTDDFARGEAIKPVLATFCRRIAKDGTNWHKWCEMKGKPRG